MGVFSITGISTNSAGTVLTAVTNAGTGPVKTVSGPATGLTLKQNGITATISSVTFSGTNILINPAIPIHIGDTVTVTYAPGNIEDSTGSPNTLSATSDHAITNNSTVSANTRLVAHINTFLNANVQSGPIFKSLVNMAMHELNLDSARASAHTAAVLQWITNLIAHNKNTMPL